MSEDDLQHEYAAADEHAGGVFDTSLPNLEGPHVALMGKGSWLKLLTLLEVSPDALVVADAAGRILSVNAQAETLFGYRSADLEGQALETLLPERFRAAHTQHLLQQQREAPARLLDRLEGLRTSHMAITTGCPCLTNPSQGWPHGNARPGNPTGSRKDDLDVVGDCGHPGRPPGGRFGQVELAAGCDLPRERHVASRDLHHDLVIGQFGIACEGSRNAALDLLG